MTVIRRLLTPLALLSLAVCVGVLVMWAHSDRVRDARQMRWHGSAYALFSDRGRIGIDNTPTLQAFETARRRQIESWLAEERRLMSYLATRDEDGPRTMYTANHNFAARASLAPAPPLVAHSIPYWSLIPALLICPALWALRYRRRLIRMSRGLCPECAYDLRGSPDRCPECGTPVHSTREAGS